MRKKTIGEVLRIARINQGMNLEDLQKKTDIQLELLEAMEADDFDRLPSPFYARSFLRKYAWAVDLDERIILDAYEEGSMIVIMFGHMFNTIHYKQPLRQVIVL